MNDAQAELSEISDVALIRELHRRGRLLREERIVTVTPVDVEVQARYSTRWLIENEVTLRAGKGSE